MAKRRWRKGRRIQRGLAKAPKREPDRRGIADYLLQTTSAAAGLIVVIAGYAIGIFVTGPTVAPSFMDPQSAFRVPFIVSNNHFLTLRDVRPTCGLNSVRTRTGEDLFKNVDVVRDMTMGDVATDEGKRFDCEIRGLGPQVGTATITMKIKYGHRFWPWRRQSDFVFHLERESDGTPHWVPGPDLTPTPHR